MRSWRNPLFAALLGLAAAGCVTTNDTLKLDLPAENKALVKGLAENKAMTGVERTLSFTAIDGVSTYRGWGKGYPISVELPAGHHSLTMLYRITDQGAPGPTGEITKEIEVRGGRMYLSDLRLEDGRCDVTFREVTDAEMREREQRRQQMRAEQMDGG
jgi:hypothetical protein